MAQNVTKGRIDRTPYRLQAGQLSDPGGPTIPLIARCCGCDCRPLLCGDSGKVSLIHASGRITLTFTFRGVVDVTAVPSSHCVACADVVQDVTKGRIDSTVYRLVGRMQSPNMYCRTRDTFPLDVPRV